MPTKTRGSHKRELAYHPFELIGANVVWEHHYNYVKRILEAKIERGHISMFVKPKMTMHIHEIFYETPKYSYLANRPTNPNVKNPYAPYLDNP